jgi:hypothetical protein
VTAYPHLPSSIAPIPESVFHPKRPTQVVKGPRYDFHEENNLREEKSQSKEVYPKTSSVPLLTPQSTSTIMGIISETLSNLPSLNGMDDVKTTELPTVKPETRKKISTSQSKGEDQMKLKIQRERKFKHLVAIVAPLVGTFIFFTGLAIGVIILVWQLDWVVLQRLRWHVSAIKSEYSNFTETDKNFRYPQSFNLLIMYHIYITAHNTITRKVIYTYKDQEV